MFPTREKKLPPTKRLLNVSWDKKMFTFKTRTQIKTQNLKRVKAKFNIFTAIKIVFKLLLHYKRQDVHIHIHIIDCMMQHFNC